PVHRGRIGGPRLRPTSGGRMAPASLACAEGRRQEMKGRKPRTRSPASSGCQRSSASAYRSAHQKRVPQRPPEDVVAPRLGGIGRLMEVVHHHRTAHLRHLGVQAFLALAIERLGPTHRFDDNIAPNPARPDPAHQEVRDQRRARCVIRRCGRAQIPSILWAYDIETGFALVLAIAPGPANADFRPDDRDFAIALLGVLLDAYRRLQAANADAREAAGLLPDRTSGNIFRINEAKPLISEAEVERMLRADERVQHALYIEWDDIHSFVFVTPDTTKGYSLLRRYRGQSPRTFKDPRAIIRFGREGLRYRGELAIYPRDDARVAALVEYARPLMAAAAAREQDPQVRPGPPMLLSEYLSNG